jgi:hypothetical protein
MTATSPRLIPLWLKIAYTAFMSVLIPIYLKNYGPTNFLYFCDVAAIMTVIAIWIESPLLVSAALVGIFLPQMLWVADFFCVLFGGKITGMTKYMFNPPYFLRFLSFFHFWLPFLLVYLVWRVGYDKRGVLLWSGITWVLLTVCYVWMPPASPSMYPRSTEPPVPPITTTTHGDIRGKVVEGQRSNVLVKLLDESGEEIARTCTQVDGSYVFAWIPPGRYRVQLRDPNVPVNIDYVHNIVTDEEPQKWMDPDLYFALYMIILVMGIFVPTHLLFRWLMPGPRGNAIPAESTPSSS